MGIPVRSGILSQLVFIDEGASFDTDPGGATGYVLNLAAASGFGTSQARAEAPVFKNTRRNYPSVLGAIQAGGRVPQQLEFLTFPRQLKVAHGALGYTRFGGLHQFYTPTSSSAVPGSCQLQGEFTQPTLACLRNRGIMINNIGLRYATSGVAGLDVDYVGIGDEVQTQLVSGANIVDEGFVPVSFFNGHTDLNTIALQGLTGADLNFSFGIQRVDAAFQGGKAAGLAFGTMALTGTINLLMSTTGSNPENDLNFYNQAVNNQAWPIDMAWSNAPEATADSWCRLQAPTAFFERMSPKPGGQNAIQIAQRFRAESFNGADNLAAEYVLPTRGASFNISGTNNIFGVKIDGGSEIDVTLTSGAARTPTQIVADLNASGPFTAVAVASVFMGRVRVKSKGTTGSLTSVQMQAPANNVNSTLGADVVAHPGFSNCPYLITVNNAKVTDY